MGGVEDGRKSSFIIGMHQSCLSVISAEVSSVTLVRKVIQVMLTIKSPFGMSTFDASVEGVRMAVVHSWSLLELNTFKGLHLLLDGPSKV